MEERRNVRGGKQRDTNITLLIDRNRSHIGKNGSGVPEGASGLLYKKLVNPKHKTRGV